MLRRLAFGTVCTLLAACAVAPRSGGYGGAPLPDPNELMRQAQESMSNRLGGNVQSQSAQTDDGVQVVLQSGHAQDITQTAMSSDGREILTGSQDGTVKLWDVASGQELRTFSGFFMGLSGNAVFSADGRSVVIHDGLQTYLFDHATGQKLKTLDSTSLASLGGSAVIAERGRYIAKSVSDRASLGGNSSKIDIVDLVDGKTIWSTPSGDTQVPLALSDDGKVLIVQRTKMHVGFFGGPNVATTVEAWDVGAKKARGPLPFAAERAELVLSPDGRYIVVENALQPAQLFALDAAQPLATLSRGADYNYGAHTTFSADGSMLLRPGDQGTVELRQVPSGALLKTIPAKAASFGPNDRILVLGVAGSGAPALYDIATGRQTRLSGGAIAVWDLAALRGGRSAAVTMQDGSTRLWDLTTGQLERNLDCPEGTGAVSVVAGHDPSTVVVGCSDGSAWVWTLGTDAAPRALLPPLHDLFARELVRLTPDGRRAVVAHGIATTRDGKPVASSSTGTISVLDLVDGREVGRIALPPASMKSFGGSEMSDDEMKALPKEMRESMQRAQAAQQTPENQAMMQAAANSITDMAVHPNSRVLAVARADDVTIWDLDSGRLVSTLGKSPASTQPGNDPRAAAQALGRGGATGADAKQLQKLMGQLGGGAVVVGDDAEDAMAGMFTGATHLDFRSDGALLATNGAGAQLWDVTTGARIRTAFGRGALRSMVHGGTATLPDMDEMFQHISIAQFSPDGRIVALVDGAQIHLQDAASGAELAVLRGHRTEIASIAFTPDGARLLSGGRDGVLRIWSVPRAAELVQLIALGHSDFVAVTPDQYYRASKSRIKGIAFRVGDQLYPFEQFDLRFNRPDIVLERLGLSDAASVQAYRQAYQRRLKKLGFTDAMLGADFHLPTVALVGTEVPVSTEAATLPITISAQDDKYPLDRLQVFVNDVPVFGTRGVPIDGEQHTVQRKVDVPLVAGRNKIQVSVLNRQGAESLRQTAYTNAIGAYPPGDVYLVTIGVSKYANAAYNLRYAAKDAGDFASAYAAVAPADDKSDAQRGAVHVLELTNERATRDEIRAARDWLEQAKVGDLAIVFAAGHGMTDAADAYYFGTYDIDPQNPSAHGLPYEDFEGLLDGIAPLRKMLLIDTCFSGEIDRDDSVVVARSDDSTQGQVSMRAFKAERGVQVVADETPAVGALDTALLRFQQDWFADLRRGTGAVVISSASGNEYAFEGEQWNNGVFTYALLQGLRNGAADTDHDQRITVGELQAYVIERVRKLTAGGQNPTVRRENLDYDFTVY
jgi:WD40 repeat protein